MTIMDHHAQQLRAHANLYSQCAVRSQCEIGWIFRPKISEFVTYFNTSRVEEFTFFFLYVKNLASSCIFLCLEQDREVKDKRGSIELISTWLEPSFSLLPWTIRRIFLSLLKDCVSRTHDNIYSSRTCAAVKNVRFRRFGGTSYLYLFWIWFVQVRHCQERMIRFQNKAKHIGDTCILANYSQVRYMIHNNVMSLCIDKRCCIRYHEQRGCRSAKINRFLPALIFSVCSNSDFLRILEHWFFRILEQWFFPYSRTGIFSVFSNSEFLPLVWSVFLCFLFFTNPFCVLTQWPWAF